MNTSIDKEEDSDVVGFPVAISISLIILIGFSMGVWGMTISHGLLFVLGVGVTLLGLLLYAVTLTIDGLLERWFPKADMGHVR